MVTGMNSKTSDNSEQIYDSLNSLWGSRIVGGIFVLIVGWGIVSKIIEAAS